MASVALGRGWRGHTAERQSYMLRRHLPLARRLADPTDADEAAALLNTHDNRFSPTTPERLLECKERLHVVAYSQTRRAKVDEGARVEPRRPVVGGALKRLEARARCQHRKSLQSLERRDVHEDLGVAKRGEGGD